MKYCEMCNSPIKQKSGSPKICSDKCKKEKERRRSRYRYYNEEGYKEKVFERCYAYAKSQKGKDYVWKWNRLKKGTWEAICEICGEKRFIEKCHIVARSKKGSEDKNNILLLCPTHHKILDNWLINSRGNQFTKEEYDKIKDRVEFLITPRKI